jgi:hypothetical protein
MPLPVLAQVLGSLGQAHAAAVAAFDPVQDFIHAGPPGEAAKLSGQELLQGLALALCALLKGCVHVVGKVADEQIRHAYIMQASVAAEQVAAASRHNAGKALDEQTRALAALCVLYRLAQARYAHASAAVQRLRQLPAASLSRPAASTTVSTAVSVPESRQRAGQIEGQMTKCVQRVEAVARVGARHRHAVTWVTYSCASAPGAAKRRQRRAEPPPGTRGSHHQRVPAEAVMHEELYRQVAEELAAERGAVERGASERDRA